MKKIYIAITEFLTLLTSVPLWFIRYFHDTGHLPDKNGAIVEVHYYYNIFENLSALDLQCFNCLYFALIGAFLITALVAIFCGKKKLFKALHFFFAGCILFFLVCFCLASSVARGY